MIKTKEITVGSHVTEKCLDQYCSLCLEWGLRKVVVKKKKKKKKKKNRIE
jgi:hypothetical protein